MKRKSGLFRKGLCSHSVRFYIGELHDAETWRDPLRPFFRTHCIDCHQGTEAEGELDLSALPSHLSDAELMRRWVLVHDRLNAGEMPPKDHPFPTQAEIAKSAKNICTKS